MPSCQLGVFVCVGLWLGAAASSAAYPRQNPPENQRRDTQKLVRYASGAGRKYASWTLGTEDEASTMRALFKVHLRQCNMDRLEEEALAVSELDSPRYGQHLSGSEVCGISSCTGRAEGVGVKRILEWVLGVTVLPEGFLWEEGKWLTREDGRDGVMAKVLCSHVVVSMSAAAAADTFPEAAFRPHRRRKRTPGWNGSFPNGNASGGGGGGGGGERTSAAILRATGDILVPEALAQHVEFVSGLTELWVPDARHGKLHGAGAGGRFAGVFGGVEKSDFTEVLVQPRTLRTLYGVPDGERGGWAGQGNNRQGVAAFDDFYLPEDLCAAHNLLAPESDWLSPPDVTDDGVHFYPDAGEEESDVGTQYMTLMGPGVPVTFAPYAVGRWVLDWADEAAEGDLMPEFGGPLVWSISASAPEAWTCYVQGEFCDDESTGLHGYDPSLYLHSANFALMKLALLGVSVLASSGDNGSGMAPTCPIDPKLPVDVSGGAVEGTPNACPFENRDDCNCASFEMVLQASTNTSRCILPLGLVVASMEIEAPGAECLDVLQAPDCVNLLEKIENGTLPSAHQRYHEDIAAASGTDVFDVGLAPGSEDAPSCQMAFLASNLSFYSSCKCKDVPTMTEGTCSLSGFTFQPEKDGATPFTPGFPASSPWVTSVGATQIGWDLGGSCKQSDLLGPGNALSAETAVDKFTGGFDGGGGFSTFFPAHDYQASHTKGYADSGAAPPTDTFNSTNRGFPDISAAGHNFVAVVGGRVEQVSSTSASAPALAGMISLMNERLLAAGKPPLGFLNPALYKAAEESPSSFQKILPKTYNLTGTPFQAALGPSYQVGSNKCSRFSCCELGYGGSADGSWDPVTGLGTINYQALSDYLNIPPSPDRPKPGRGHDRHRTAYVTWIVVLVIGLVAATLLLVYEHRPKLVLSAATLGRRINIGGGDDEFRAYARGGGNDGGSGGWGGGGVGARTRGALTEMVMESEVGTVSGDAAYRLLEEDGVGYDDYDDDHGHGLEGQKEEGGEQGRGEGSSRRSV